MTTNVGIVVIGRNEGPRLRACLDAVAGSGLPVVYVDSGSSDDSLLIARAAGTDTLELDAARPFTAGRGRNEGLKRLLERHPNIQLVQFVDGDCELQPGWLERGVSALCASPRVAAVCGRVRERFREATIYNRLCDLEWYQPPGEVQSCGGNALWRARAFLEAGGFDPTLIAGEEPDLCLRVRASGWNILRIDVEMVLHDAAMTRFAEWWRRGVRSGHGYAEGWHRHRRTPHRFWVHETRSIVFWGALVPLTACALLLPTAGLSLVALLGYPALAFRVHQRMRRMGLSARDARLYAFFCMLAKFPQALGVLEFTVLQLLGRHRPVVDWRAIPPGANAIKAACFTKSDDPT